MCICLCVSPPARLVDRLKKRAASVALRGWCDVSEDVLYTRKVIMNTVYAWLGLFLFDGACKGRASEMLLYPGVGKVHCKWMVIRI